MSIWAEGFNYDSIGISPKKNLPECRPGYKRCGYNCIKQSYNCEAEAGRVRRERVGRAIRYSLYAPPFVVGGGYLAKHAIRGNKAGMAQATKRLRDVAVEEAAGHVGATAAIAGLTYGLSAANKARRKKEREKK